MTPPPNARPRKAQPPDVGGYVTAVEIAAQLGITTERVRQLASRAVNPIPCLPTPLGRLFWPGDVAAWAATRTDAGVPARGQHRGRATMRPTNVEPIRRRRA